MHIYILPGNEISRRKTNAVCQPASKQPADRFVLFSPHLFRFISFQTTYGIPPVAIASTKEAAPVVEGTVPAVGGVAANTATFMRIPASQWAPILHTKWRVFPASASVNKYVVGLLLVSPTKILSVESQ